jgi:hypothetical protein
MATNVNFSLSPGMATTNVIDYTTTAGQPKVVEQCDRQALHGTL